MGDKAREALVREARAALRVARFCTASVLAIDLDGDQPYIVSEFVDGPSLHSLVRTGGPFTASQALHRLAVGMATALTAIHRAGIVHRDFKPANVLVGPDGPRVIDFGIARILDATHSSTDQFMGTAPYMAPEQIHGSKVGPEADVFAWGSTVTFAASGRPPFGQDAVPAIVNRVLHGEPDLSGVPVGLREVVGACLDKHPDRRPSAQEVLLELLTAPGDAPAEVSAALLSGSAQASLVRHAPPPPPSTQANTTISAHPLPTPGRTLAYPPQESAQWRGMPPGSAPGGTAAPDSRQAEARGAATSEGSGAQGAMAARWGVPGAEGQGGAPDGAGAYWGGQGWADQGSGPPGMDSRGVRWSPGEGELVGRLPAIRPSGGFYVIPAVVMPVAVLVWLVVASPVGHAAALVLFAGSVVTAAWVAVARGAARRRRRLAGALVFRDQRQA
ncbi:protein kinase [Nonomuraea sp. NPDC050556]|uniref:serine/threonine-protein kinase n=1 Tax=Nonomuraea sp. NPDC050556 TaxID=3364369 RepID=UPI0037B66BD5